MHADDRSNLTLPAEASDTPIQRIVSPFVRFAGWRPRADLCCCSALPRRCYGLIRDGRIRTITSGTSTFPIGLGSAALKESLLHFINDGLMAVFFFFVGLEIKHELLAGELSTLKRATFPLAAAVGGAIASGR